MVRKPKDTQHKKIYQYQCVQTNSPPKLVTSKTFFPLTWSSPPKSITLPKERYSILKFLILFDMIVKGHRKPKNLTEDRQKIDIEVIRRTRNHRPIRRTWQQDAMNKKGEKKMQNSKLQKTF